MAARERQRAKERALPIHRAELQVVDRRRGRLAVAVRGDVAQIPQGLFITGREKVRRRARSTNDRSEERGRRSWRRS
jgi:hypothetical protein